MILCGVCELNIGFNRNCDNCQRFQFQELKINDDLFGEDFEYYEDNNSAARGIAYGMFGTALFVIGIIGSVAYPVTSALMFAAIAAVAGIYLVTTR